MLIRPAVLFACLLAASVACATDAPALAPSPDAQAVKAVLSSYKSALEKLDLSGVDALFSPMSEVVESGTVEGSYANYRDHHLGPELGHFKSFLFSDYKVTVRIELPLALATETYRYTIVLKNKPEPIERQGVATSVLKKIDGRWTILSTHSSSRAPKKAAASK